jgi:cytochrome bd ubiquinol oxidase subunit II
MTPEMMVAGAMLISLTLYALGGGADFGGGVWDLFATGPDASKQRQVIAKAIGPIWEANHVWLILLIVLLFVGFPVAFGVISTALHIPLTIMLIGIVLRGSAFTFRTYDDQTDEVQRRWSRIFAISSIITPVMLGICIGAVASGRIHFDMATDRLLSGFVSSWLAPFPIAVGIFTLVLFAFLAAVYLTMETKDETVQEGFRRKALIASFATGALAFVCLWLAETGAPLVRWGLLHAKWSIPFQIITGLAAAGCIVALWRRNYRIARWLAILQVTLIIWGWGFAQYPYLVEPHITFQNTAAPRNVLTLLLIALGCGAVVLFPSMFYLFKVFKLNPPIAQKNHAD